MKQIDFSQVFLYTVILDWRYKKVGTDFWGTLFFFYGLNKKKIS